MSDFDRVRPRTPVAPPHQAGRPTARVSDGRQALFSAGDPDGGAGAVRIECSRCGTASAVSPLRALRLATPCLVLPGWKRGFPTYLTCPSCRRRSWVRVSRWHR